MVNTMEESLIFYHDLIISLGTGLWVRVRQNRQSATYLGMWGGDWIWKKEGEWRSGTNLPTFHVYLFICKIGSCFLQKGCRRWGLWYQNEWGGRLDKKMHNPSHTWAEEVGLRASVGSMLQRWKQNVRIGFGGEKEEAKIHIWITRLSAWVSWHFPSNGYWS